MSVLSDRPEERGGAQLGACGRCFRIALIGTVVDVGAVALLGRVPHIGALRLVARLVTAAFSIALAAHVVAYGIRRRARAAED